MPGRVQGIRKAHPSPFAYLCEAEFSSMQPKQHIVTYREIIFAILTFEMVNIILKPITKSF